MSKVIFISVLLFAAFVGCQKNNAVEPFNYERDTPLWLKVKIDSMSTNQEYFGTEVYRYEWNGKFVYHITSIINSCMFCDVFDQNGNKIQLTSEDVLDFQQNKKNEVLVWRWT